MKGGLHGRIFFHWKMRVQVCIKGGRQKTPDTDSLFTICSDRINENGLKGTDEKNKKFDYTEFGDIIQLDILIKEQSAVAVDY